MWNTCPIITVFPTTAFPCTQKIKHPKEFLGKTLGIRMNPNLDPFWGLESSRFCDTEKYLLSHQEVFAKVWLPFSTGSKTPQVLLWLYWGHWFSQWQCYLWLLLHPELPFSASDSCLHLWEDSLISPKVLQGPEHQRFLPLGTQKGWDGDRCPPRQSYLSVWWCTVALGN